ncbi:MAG: S-layer protein [Caulobacter sp.]
MAYTTAQLVTAYTNANLGKAPDAATTLTLDAYATQSQTGGISDATALANTLKLVNSTTAVAIQTYQFFTGAAPSAAGLDYLVDSTTNTTDLNDAYYAKFAQENRFINFSINLATGSGAGASAFAAAYTGVSYQQTVATAYDKIIGNAAAAAAGVDVAAAVAYLSRQANIDYLTAFVKANTGLTAAADIDLAVKAALIGTILNAATVSGIGGYAKSTAAMITDLSDGVLSTDNANGVNILTSYPAGSVGGQSLTLTTGVDTVTGSSNDDTITGVIDTTGSTLTALDTINGGAGNDTLVINSIIALTQTPISGVTVSGVETVNIRGAVAVTADVSAWTDVTALNVTQGAAVAVGASSAANINVSGATGQIDVDGGKNVTITDSSAGTDINVGATTRASGDVSVTATNAGASSIAVDGGKAVTLTVSGTSGGADTITVGNGGAAADLPSGVVTVTSGHKATAGTDVTLNAITVKGGSTISVTQTSDTSASAGDTTGATLTQGAVTIVGGSTSSVTVAQAASKTEVVAVTAVTAAKETASVKFVAATAGQTITVAGLTFTATGAMTASEVASAFANLIASDTMGAGAATKGVYTGALSGYTSGAASGDTVVFTATGSGNVADIVVGGTAAPAATVTNGVAAVASKAGVLGVITGVVTIDDAATAAITTVSVNGYGTGSTIGSTTTLSKLATLSLANSGGATAGATNGTMTVDAAGVATLGLTLNNVKGAVDLDGAADGALKTLNVTTSGASSSFALTAAAVTGLTVAGDKSLTLTGSTLTALKTVSVSGSAGLTLTTNEADTLTSVDTSATTGSVTAFIEGTRATYTGGAGTDKVTLNTDTALTKAISLGAGDDTLTFGVAVTGSTATLAGGDGTDTLVMSTANADALDATKQTFYTGFERLTLNTAAGDVDASADTVTLNLDNLGLVNYVTTAGVNLDGANTDTLVLDKLATGGTVVLTAQGLFQANVTDASTNTADVVNVTLSAAGALTAGTFTAANVETINVTTVDTDTDTSNPDAVTLTLTAADATKVNVAGNQSLTLTMTGSTKVTTIDASAATGALTVTSLNTTSATTITGGSASDTLTAATGTTADVLNGGAGNDALNGNAGLSILTGGAGNDTFGIVAAANVNSYNTITDLSAGDLIKITGITSFTNAKVTLGDTAVFQDYANAAINALAANGAGWFQYAGNTYIVADLGANGTAFTNAEDAIVKLTGLVDLSGAALNSTNGTIGL